MSDRSRTDEQLLDLPDPEGLSGEQLDSQVQRAQHALFELKRQQEQIEKQKRELEELSRRQEQLQAGKSEMLEKFTRAMVVLEREYYDAQKRVEHLQAIQQDFQLHMQTLESINPRAWEGLDINKELTKALSAVDDARAEYNKSLPKISPESDTGSSDPVAATMGYQADLGGGTQDFAYWLKAGFAFTLPLFLLGLLFVIIIASKLPVQ